MVEPRSDRTGPLTPGATMGWDVLAAVAAGGALGASARLGVSEAIGRETGRWPWETLLENVSGAFALGLLLVVLLTRWPTARLVRPFLGAGVLGSYTTFSAVAVEANLLGRDGEGLVAVAYLVATLAAGLAAAWAGAWCGRRAGRNPGSVTPPGGTRR